MGSPDLLLVPETTSSPKPKPSAGFAVLMLAFCCLCWGLSFPVVQQSTTIVDSAISHPSTQITTALRPTFNGWRFSAAAIVYFLLTFTRQRNYSRSEVMGGLIIGSFFFGGVLLQLLGLRYTVPSVSAFLTALAIVFVPLAQTWILHRPISGKIWISVVLAVVGTVLLSWPASSSGPAGTFVQTPPVPYLGEMLTIAGSVLFTAQIFALDHYGKSSDPTRLTFVMLATAGVLGLTSGIAMGGLPVYALESLSFLAHSFSFWWTFLCLVLVSCVIAMHLMNRYQPMVLPAVATVIYCLEPVFSSIFSVLLGAETLTSTILAGGVIIIAAVLVIAKGT